MESFRFFNAPLNPQPLVLPTYITFQAATATKSAYVSAYGNEPEPIATSIQRTVQRLGGMSTCQAFEANHATRQLLIGAQLPGLSSSDLWRIRDAIQRAGGIIETTRVDYQIRRPAAMTPQRPQACEGCQYYYGNIHGSIQLVCALHPFGPDDTTCRDWSGNENRN